MRSWKKSKPSWMGHGVWMGITCGNMEDGQMGSKHSSWNITCFGGICFKGSNCSGIEMHVEPPVETWHVLVGGRFQGSSFKAHVLWCTIFDWPIWVLGCHQNTTCFCVSLLQGLYWLCVETCAELPQSELCIYNLLLNNVRAFTPIRKEGEGRRGEWRVLCGGRWKWHFYMSGGLNIAIAVRVPGINAVVAFYGTPPPQFADPVEAKVPVQAHLGQNDTLKGLSNKKVSFLFPLNIQEGSQEMSPRRRLILSNDRAL